MGDKNDKHPFLKRSTTNISSKLNTSKTKSSSIKTSIQSTNTSNLPISTNKSQKKHETTKTFAETTASSLFPKKDQAIIFNTIEGIPQIEYINVLSTLTNPVNILFASRISNNRFCVYFANKNIVNDLIDQNPTITVNNHTIFIRKLVNQSKRIILSNVSPIIPHTYITNALNNIGINTLAPISFVKAGFSTDSLSHIISFRRQTYIKHEDISKLPGSILINFEDDEYRIFLTDDTLTCYLCKRTGHTSAHCKNTTPNPDNQNNNLISNSSQTLQSTTDYLSMETNQNVINNNKDSDTASLEEKTPKQKTPPPLTENKDNNINNNKRPAPSSSTSLPASPFSITSETDNIQEPPISNIVNSEIKPEKKKVKVSSRSNSLSNIDQLNEVLEPAKQVFIDNPEFKINYHHFKAIIENSQNCNDKLSLCLNYNIEPQSLIQIIELTYPTLKNKSIKNRLTRLSNALFQLDKQDHDSHEKTDKNIPQ